MATVAGVKLVLSTERYRDTEIRYTETPREIQRYVHCGDERVPGAAGAGHPQEEAGGRGHNLGCR